MPRSLHSGAKLPDVLHELSKNLEKDGVQFEFLINESFPSTGKEVNVMIFRLIKELTDYVIEYRKATVIACQLQYTKGVLLLSVKDNGDVNMMATEDDQKMLKNICTKIELYDGNIEIRPGPYKGILYEITFSTHFLDPNSSIA